MALQQNVATTLTIADESVWGTAATAGGASQILRRVSSTLSLNKDVYQSAEVLQSRQIVDSRHGTRRVQGDISGELSPNSYEMLFEAWTRGTWAATTTITEATVAMSSATLSISSNVITASAGSFITSGLRIGTIIRLGAGFAAGNQGKNLRITAMTATSLTVVGATLTNEAGPLATYSISIPGKSVYVPETGHVNRSFTVEVNYSDIDVSELYTGCRVGRMQIGLPGSGMATSLFGFTGRDMSILSGASAPYFTSATAATSSGILAAVNGSLLINGTSIAVVTGMELTGELSAQSDAVVGSNYTPDVFLGRAALSGNVTMLLENSTYIDAFINESELSLAAQLNVDNSDATDFFSVFMPRIKLGSATVQRQGEGGIPVSFSFQALKKSAATGHTATTVLIQDSMVS